MWFWLRLWLIREKLKHPIIGIPFRQNYLLFYKIIADLLLTMILPFALLVHYSIKILRVLSRRRRMVNRPLQVMMMTCFLS